ncbi:MAG: hypothetical protein HYZ65_07545 [Burkholderiales bacterium]|nr:hypothetical protein [Burkholderiales bacterium]
MVHEKHEKHEKKINIFRFVIPAQGEAGNLGSLLPACVTARACKLERALQAGIQCRAS